MKTPVYRVSHSAAQTSLVEYIEAVPWWLFDRLPQGFTGRVYAKQVLKQHPEFSSDLRDWSDAVVLQLLSEYPVDAIGNLLIGNHELLNRSGKSDGMNNYENLRDTLARLASVTIRVQNESEDYAVRLLAYHVDIKTNQIKVAVNTKSAAAILGERYSYISLSDHRQLNSEPAKIIHGWLSSWMSQGDNRRIKLDSLATHIYPTFELVQNNSKAVYRSRTKQAVESLKSIGWKVDIAGRGEKVIVVIGRPKAAKGLPYQQL